MPRQIQQEDNNSKNSIKNKLFKIFNVVIINIFYFSIISLLLNSFWYILRLELFNRKLTLGSFGSIYTIVVYLNILVVFFSFAVYKKKRDNVVLITLFQLVIILYSLFMVYFYIDLTYFDISPWVKHYWESGEWTF